MSKIFISYRRDDSAGYAHAIHSQLVQHFSKDQVFMDVDTVEPGVDFVRVIEEAVGDCHVLLALIGSKWASRGRGAMSRLDDPKDFIRLEISTALARDIRVIPLLVDGMKMPSEETLPASLKPLTRRNAMEISHTRFDYDVERVVTAVRLALGVDEKAPEGETGLLEHVREQMLLSTSAWELRKALYELDAHLAKFPHSTEARLLRHQIEGALQCEEDRLREREETSRNAVTERRDRSPSRTYRPVGGAAAVVVGMALIAFWFFSASGSKTADVKMIVSLGIQGKRQLNVGEKTVLRVGGRLSDGSEIAVTKNLDWQSSDDSVVAVSGDGQVKARKDGFADITVRYEGIVSPPLTMVVRGKSRSTSGDR